MNMLETNDWVNLESLLDDSRKMGCFLDAPNALDPDMGFPVDIECYKQQHNLNLMSTFLQKNQIQCVSSHTK